MAIIARGIRYLALFSTVSGLVTLIVCCWTFGVMISEPGQFEEPHDKHRLTKRSEKIERNHFVVIMYASIWCANLALLTQIISSGLTGFGKNKNVWTIAKYFVIVHFLVFVVLLICLFVPLAEDRKRTTAEIPTFNDYITDEFGTFAHNGLTYLGQGCHAYYLVIGLDAAFIFLCMIFVCCLLRCETKNGYDAV